MSKGLEAFGKITGTQNLTMYEQNECLKTIEKELKALEIIKNKRVNVNLLLAKIESPSPAFYNMVVGLKYKLTQEEYDLLKEVLL